MTDRQREILRLIANGLDTEQIARRLHYSQRTIKKDFHELAARFGFRNRAHAAAYAVRAGWI